MSNYFMVKSSSIKALRKEWDKFIDACFDEVNDQYREKSSSYHREACDDKYHERYTEDSIDEWYRDGMSELNEWAESLKEDFRETYRKGKKIIDEIENKRFYDDETGYKYTLRFCDGEIEREDNDDTYSIVFEAMSWTIGSVTVHFDPSYPEYTEWMPSRSR